MLRIRALLNQILAQSVASGWIDIDTYAYQQFVYADMLSIPEVLDFVAGMAVEQAALTTHDLELANELYRQIRRGEWQRKNRKWWQIF